MALTLENVFNTGGKVLGALQTYDLYNTSKNIEGRADPFAQYRPGYGKQLKGLMDDPSSFENDPAYKFMREQGEETVARKMAAGGYDKSGNMAAELAQFASGLAHSYRGQELDRLATLAGAGISPSPASTALTGKAQAFDQTGDLLASLGYDLAGDGTLGKLVSGGVDKVSGFLKNVFGGGGAAADLTTVAGANAAVDAAATQGFNSATSALGEGGFLKNAFSPTNLANLAGLAGGAIVTNQLANSKEGQIGGNIGAVAGTMLSGGSGIALGAKLGMAAGPVGAVIGAALGSVLGNAFGNEAKNVGIVQDVTNGIVELQKT